MERIPYLGHTILKWQVGASSFLAIPEKGARLMNWNVTLDDGGFSAQFMPDAAAKAAYPYDYEFVVSYRFDPVAVFVELQLTNHGRTPIPWSAGHHFYFTLPWSPGRARGDYLLETTATKY